jgi:signal transduction histidine kinase
VSILEDTLAFIELGDDDRARLTELHARLAPAFGAIADRFCEVVAASSAAARLEAGGAQLSGMRAALIDWMSSGLLGPYDAAFHERRARIGRRFIAIGLPQHYVLTAMNVIRGEYDTRIASLYSPDEARRVGRSVNKLLDVELALMLGPYLRDSEDQLARERRIQTERVTAIQTMSAGLAHEVRNPLNSAKLQLELLERRLRREYNDPKLVQPVELVRDEIERLTRLLNEFLAFARPPELDLARQDVVVLARGVVAVERPLADRRGATLSLSADGPVTAMVDPAKLGQILQNLIRNAIEAVAPGGAIAVSVRGDACNLYLTVSDDGPGIPEAVRSRIYEPFFSTKDGGTGLGMSIVHSMVTLHGGTIDVASSPDGTRFEVKMPRAPSVPIRDRMPA